MRPIDNRLNIVAVRVEHKRRVIPRMVRARSRGSVVASTGCQRRIIKRLDGLLAIRAERDMGRCWSRPGLRGGDVEIAARRAIIHPETDSRLVMGFGKVPEWCQRFRVKLNGTVGIVDMQGHMVNHDSHYRRASARSAQALSVSVRRCIDPGLANTVTTGAHSWWAVVCTISSVARVAQWIEHRSPKAGVARSNRVPGTIPCRQVVSSVRHGAASLPYLPAVCVASAFHILTIHARPLLNRL